MSTYFTGKILDRESNYLTGDCWLFALELQRHTGWQTYITYFPQGLDASLHVMCKAPDGRFIDATGWCDYVNNGDVWDQSQLRESNWVEKYCPQYADTQKYLTEDVRTVLDHLNIYWEYPEGHCVVDYLIENRGATA